MKYIRTTIFFSPHFNCPLGTANALERCQKGVLSLLEQKSPLLAFALFLFCLNFRRRPALLQQFGISVSCCISFLGSADVCTFSKDNPPLSLRLNIKHCHSSRVEGHWEVTRGCQLGSLEKVWWNPLLSYTACLLTTRKYFLHRNCLWYWVIYHVCPSGK